MSGERAIQLQIEISGAPDGPLGGLQWVVKDVIDVAGCPTTAGNPAWAAAHPRAERHAEVVARILGAGARLVGKAVTDELAFSLNGSNPHYGTPANPAAPGCLPGGSSSGSASAVASELCDFALGTDTGGSTRLPASYCGIFGMRPTWGRTDMRGVLPLAPSFDTVGWLARDVTTMRQVAEVILDGQDESEQLPAVLVPVREAFEVTEPAVGASLLQELGARLNDRLCASRALGADLREWASVRRTIQSYETWAIHGDWAQRNESSLGRGVHQRLFACAQMTRAAYDEACADRERIIASLESFVEPGQVLVLPSAPAPAPSLRATPEQLRWQWERAFALLSPAVLWGAPQLTVPLRTGQHPPVGLGLVARPRRDRALLACWEDVERAPSASEPR